jgi:hypothetical protein
VRQQLQAINSRDGLDREGAALLEQLIRYATAERLREGLRLLGTAQKPEVRTIVLPAHIPEAERLAILAQRSAGHVMTGARAGRTYGGCTMSINLSANPDPDSSVDPSYNPQEAYGGLGKNGEDKDSWVWKRGVCRIPNCPTRPQQTTIGPCSVLPRLPGLVSTEGKTR